MAKKIEAEIVIKTKSAQESVCQLNQGFFSLEKHIPQDNYI